MTLNPPIEPAAYLAENDVYLGDAVKLLGRVAPSTVHLSFWSPPYHVGKEYEEGIPFEAWRQLLTDVITLHSAVLVSGGFMVINIADILCFKDPRMPRIQAPNIRLHRSPVSREQVLEARSKNPGFNRNQLAALLNCSEQTIDRRLNGNNIRGGKYNTQTRVKLVGTILEDAASDANLFLYDHRIWVKDPTWANSQWHSSSYRAVSEFEHLYIFWKPGETVVDRARLSATEWAEWGSRGVWHITSVRRNDDHPAKFPSLLARRVIRLFSGKGDLVLDPFVGSGTTPVAAIETGRRYMGFDQEPKYIELARRNISDANDLLFKGQM